MGFNGSSYLHANNKTIPSPKNEGKVNLTKVTFVSLVNALLKVNVSPELIKKNSYTISDGKGGRILL